MKKCRKNGVPIYLWTHKINSRIRIKTTLNNLIARLIILKEYIKRPGVQEEKISYFPGFLIKTFFLLISLLPVFTLARNLQFKGNKNLSHPARLINYTSSQPLTDSIFKDWQNRLANEYARLGYFWTAVNIETTQHKITINIQQNNQARAGQIDFKGNFSISINQLSSVLRKPRRFSNLQLEQQINRLINYYADNGYPFAKILARDFTIDEQAQTISYTIEIQENSQAIINEVYFTNTTVLNNRLKQIFRFQPGQSYSRTKTRQKLASLAESHISYRNYQILSIDTAYILEVDLKPMKSSQITGMLTYLPSDKNFNGYFYFTNHNFFNSLRRVKFALEKFGAYTLFSLEYADPYLFNFNLGAGVNHITYDTIYSQTDVNCDLKLPVNPIFSTNFKINYVRLASAIPMLNSNATWWFGQGLQFKTADLNKNIPRTYSVTIMPQIGSRRIQTQNTHLSHLDIGVHTDLPVKNRLGYTLDIVAKYIYCKDGLTMADSLRLGGIKNLRGYQENQFATNQYLLIKNELRYYLGSTTLLAFDDLALINQPDKKPVKNGFGIGLRINSKIGTVGIDYGLSQITNPLQGKIHLTFQNQF